MSDAAWALGYFGKMPSRGDFVSHGLDAATRDAMDAWCQDVLPASQEALGAGWRAAWMEAPIWRFRLRPGLFGRNPIAGVWLPSTDRAGRLFPLILAVTGPSLDRSGAVLDRLEQIGLAAIEHDLTPERMAGALTDASAVPADTLAATEGEWWTEGGPRVAAARRRSGGLPDGAGFAAMLCDGNDDTRS